MPQSCCRRGLCEGRGTWNPPARVCVLAAYKRDPKNCDVGPLLGELLLPDGRVDRCGLVERSVADEGQIEAAVVVAASACCRTARVSEQREAHASAVRQAGPTQRRQHRVAHRTHTVISVGLATACTPGHGNLEKPGNHGTSSDRVDNILNICRIVVIVATNGMQHRVANDGKRSRFLFSTISIPSSILVSIDHHKSGVLLALRQTACPSRV